MYGIAIRYRVFSSAMGGPQVILHSQSLNSLRAFS